MLVRLLSIVPALFAFAALAGPARAASAADWPLPAGSAAGTREAHGSPIDSANVARLAPAWRFTFPGTPGFSGSFASTPVVAAGVAYLQDLRSNVYALDLGAGRLRWTRRFAEENGGPNGLAVVGGRVYGNTTTRAFALEAGSGRLLWQRRLVRPGQPAIDIAPLVAGGLVFTSTTGEPPGGSGTLYALDARTGAIRWSFSTVVDPWRAPSISGGGGAWWPPALDPQGRLFVGTANPIPWGGTPLYPNGAAFGGDARWTSSLLALDAATGRLLWAYQAVPHDVRDYDVAAPLVAELSGADGPVAAVLAAGKNGRVYAWRRSDGRLLWSVPVGRHLNDTGPLPERRVTVCPGLFGGALTPPALAAGRLFVPVVDLCMQGSATGYEDLLRVDVPARGKGELVALEAASGRRLWTRRFPSPDFGCAVVANDVLFTATYDGTVYGLSTKTGATLWRARTQAGINACPAVVGDTLLVGAGAVDATDVAGATPQLVAYRLPR